MNRMLQQELPLPRCVGSRGRCGPRLSGNRLAARRKWEAPCKRCVIWAPGVPAWVGGTGRGWGPQEDPGLPRWSTLWKTSEICSPRFLRAAEAAQGSGLKSLRAGRRTRGGRVLPREQGSESAGKTRLSLRGELISGRHVLPQLLLCLPESRIPAPTASGAWWSGDNSPQVLCWHLCAPTFLSFAVLYLSLSWRYLRQNSL